MEVRGLGGTSGQNQKNIVPIVNAITFPLTSVQLILGAYYCLFCVLSNNMLKVSIDTSSSKVQNPATSRSLQILHPHLGNGHIASTTVPMYTTLSTKNNTQNIPQLSVVGFDDTYMFHWIKKQSSRIWSPPSGTKERPIVCKLCDWGNIDRKFQGIFPPPHFQWVFCAACLLP